MKTDRHLETKPAPPLTVGCPNCKGYPMEIHGVALRMNRRDATDRAVYFCTLCGFTKTETILPGEE